MDKTREHKSNSPRRHSRGHHYRKSPSGGRSRSQGYESNAEKECRLSVVGGGI